MNTASAWEIRGLIILEALFALCAASVVAYKLLGIFDFRFFSYRFFNIAASIALSVVIIRSLVRRDPRIFPVIIVFSLFHLVEGLIIGFWFKAAVHFFILAMMLWIYYKHRRLKTNGAGFIS